MTRRLTLLTLFACMLATPTWAQTTEWETTMTVGSGPVETIISNGSGGYLPSTLGSGYIGRRVPFGALTETTYTSDYVVENIRFYDAVLHTVLGVVHTGYTVNLWIRVDGTHRAVPLDWALHIEGTGSFRLRDAENLRLGVTDGSPVIYFGWPTETGRWTEGDEIRVHLTTE